MGSVPVRLAHGWALAWTDLYQTPAIVCESFYSEVTGGLKELFRGKDQYPFNTVNPQTESTIVWGVARSMPAMMDGPLENQTEPSNLAMRDPFCLNERRPLLRT